MIHFPHYQEWWATDALEHLLRHDNEPHEDMLHRF